MLEIIRRNITLNVYLTSHSRRNPHCTGEYQEINKIVKPRTKEKTQIANIICSKRSDTAPESIDN